MMKKITEVNGSISDLIAVLQEIQKEYCDIQVAVCGVQPIQIYWDMDNGAIILDSEDDLEEEE